MYEEATDGRKAAEAVLDQEEPRLQGLSEGEQAGGPLVYCCTCGRRPIRSTQE